jgi:hypothetical protein
VAKVVIPVDVTDVEAKSFQQPTPALYTMVIKEAKHRDEDGKNDIELVLQVEGSEFADSQLWTYVGLTEASQWKMRELLDALGLPPKIELDLQKHLVNKRMKVKVNGDQYQGEYRARVGRFAPLDAAAGAPEAGPVPVAEDAAAPEDEPWTEEDLKALTDDDLKAEVANFDLKDVKTSGRGWKPKAIKAILEADAAAQGDDAGDEDTNYEAWELKDQVEAILEDDKLKALLPGIEEDDAVSDDDKDFLAGFLHAADDGTIEQYLTENPWDEDGEATKEKPDYSTWSLDELKEDVARRGLKVPTGRGLKPKLVKLLEDNDGEEGDPFAS